MAQVPASVVFGFLDSEAICTKANLSCNDPSPPCKSLLKFDFPSLWKITENYYAACGNGSWLFENATYANIALNNEAAKAIAGAEFQFYPAADVWYRLTTWKFPLFQLLAASPRPPIGIAVEYFAIVHLMGDPIGALDDLLRKFEGCQARAVYWQAEIGSIVIPPLSDENVTPEQTLIRLWKAFAIIADSYDEWGSDKGDDVNRKLRALCVAEIEAHEKRNLFAVCLTTAGALAADRSTKFLPVVVAQFFFISTIAIAMIRTKSISKQKNPSTYINIEMHSIGFTALFFWLITAVFMTSIIGVSQTAGALPRILDRFAKDLQNSGFENELPSKTSLVSEDRTWQGGIYSWQPQNGSFLLAYKNSRRELDHRGISTTIRGKAGTALLWMWPLLCFCLPWAIFGAAILTGIGVSFAVPPEGWSCRSDAELAIAGFWISSYLFSIASRKFLNGNVLFRFTLIKDTFIFLGTMAIVMATQFGIYNKSSCYTKSGAAGLALPQQPATKAILQDGLTARGSYTLIVMGGILVQVIIAPSLILWRYYSACRVFLQKDEGTSNLDNPFIRCILTPCWRLFRYALASCWQLISRFFHSAGQTVALPAYEPLSRNSEGLNETNYGMHGMTRNTGQRRRTPSGPDVGPVTDGAREALLHPSEALVRGRTGFHRSPSISGSPSTERPSMAH